MGGIGKHFLSWKNNVIKLGIEKIVFNNGWYR